MNGEKRRNTKGQCVLHLLNKPPKVAQGLPNKTSGKTLELLRGNKGGPGQLFSSCAGSQYLPHVVLPCSFPKLSIHSRKMQFGGVVVMEERPGVCFQICRLREAQVAGVLCWFPRFFCR